MCVALFALLPAAVSAFYHPLALARAWQAPLSFDLWPSLLVPSHLSEPSALSLLARLDDALRAFDGCERPWREDESGGVVKYVLLAAGLKEAPVAELVEGGTQLAVSATPAAVASPGYAFEATLSLPFAVERDEAVALQYDGETGLLSVRLAKPEAPTQPTAVAVAVSDDAVLSTVLRGASEVRAELLADGKRLSLSGTRRSGAPFERVVALPFAVHDAAALSVEHSRETDLVTVRAPAPAAKPPVKLAVAMAPPRPLLGPPETSERGAAAAAAAAPRDEAAEHAMLDEKYAFVWEASKQPSEHAPRVEDAAADADGLEEVEFTSP
eukprot:CAMPEP_0119402940 /NCGR_PEP_ID=MMETSP1334-20130426/143135_1 /TAXON_ID=127549 /ORGANISM="Calcidiscus leptoporus, Strain RCC1130" /LENGTH=325 /DNA_ID=CAMNT_0007426879 /DNA_START=87 /DNA_END=1064 /DNA_ORIENTATION=+